MHSEGEAVWSEDPAFWRGRRVAVTGGTGFVGSHVVSALVDLGSQVTVLRRDRPVDSPISDRWRSTVGFVDGEVEDAATTERLMVEYEAEVIFHLAAQSQVGVANRNPLSTFEANVRGTWSVLEAARRATTVRAVVVASSDKAYGTQPVLPYREDMPLLAQYPYDVSKACADMITASYAKAFEMPAAITRCGNFFGPGDLNWERLVPGTVRSLVQGDRPVIRSDGTLSRDYLFVADGVRGYLALAERLFADPEIRGSAFNFSTETPITVLELVEILQASLGTALEPDIRAQAKGEIPHQALSAQRAREVLGWKSAFSLEEGLKVTAQWYRSWLSAG